MVTFRIKVRDQNGDELGEFDVYRSLKFNKRLNNYGQCSFEIPGNQEKASSLISLRRYSVYIYRTVDGTDTLVWSGEQAMREGTLENDGSNWVTIHCFTWLEQLNSRYTAAEVPFTSQDAGEIAWELIDTSQGLTGGDMGITEGTIIPTTDRDRTYYNQNIMEAIINLANVLSGFDFEITDAKIFNVYAIKGVDKTAEILLEYGVNMTSAHIIEDFVKPVNKAIVLGEAIGEDNLQRIERVDTDSRDLYGLRESTLSEMDVSEVESLEDKGDALLRKYSTQVLKVDMQLKKSFLSVTDFDIGDLIRLKIVNGIYNIDQTYRIFEYQVVYASDNTETLQLTLGTLNSDF
jgi:ReqiPepy6 Gp37-like protein